ncbi:conserved hypothetical protein [Vibrio chagasii]|nr:conserved hypothetical protein [Vibrio chagasii]CAH7303134.1 conserved hypothetical protein [Vibrio chagasii]
MSNIVTAVKVAVDSGALNTAVDSAKALNEEAGVKLPAGLLKAGGAIGGLAASLVSVKSHMDELYQHTEATSGAAYDLYGTMDSGVRPAMLYVAETMEAQRAEMADINDLATLATANIALGWGEANIEVKKTMNSILYGVEDAESATDKFLKDAAEKAAIAAGEISKTSTGFSPVADPEAVERNIAEIEKKMAEFEEASNTLSAASSERRLQRLEGINDTAAERRAKQFEQEIKEREAAIVLAANTSQEKVLEKELERFKLANVAFEESMVEQERISEEKRQLGIQREIDSAIASNMSERDRIDAQWVMFEEDLQRRIEAEEITYEQASELRKQKAIEQNAAIIDINERASEAVLRDVKKNANEMSNATSSALSILDSDLASLFDSLDSLVGVFQNLGWLSGGGGFWGLGGGIGGAGMGGVSSFGGVSVGSVSVTVQGNTDAVGMKNAAQEGVYGALNGIVKDTLAKESKYGGIFNPSSGTHRM